MSLEDLEEDIREKMEAKAGEPLTSEDFSIRCNWCGEVVTPLDAEYRRIEAVDPETGEGEGLEHVYVYCDDDCKDLYRRWENGRVEGVPVKAPDGEPHHSEEFAVVETGAPIVKGGQE
jgi:hypothetical protein